MNFIIGIVCIGLGIWALVSPEDALRSEDQFRIKGERRYSDFAIGLMGLRGIIAIIAGIVLLFLRF